MQCVNQSVYGIVCALVVARAYTYNECAGFEEHLTICKPYVEGKIKNNDPKSFTNRMDYNFYQTN